MAEKLNYLRYPLLKQIMKGIFKLLLFIILLVIIFIVGLIIGYAVLGDGNYWEVFNQDTWLHLLTFIE
ncbi:DNA-directed RNA polymerase subunit beta [Facklamia miroungae]|uniref:DNA-directed RNA polymerase subunit beta n=1 Tax=Facklamia miroungae TaxID=120956 RepID=A0A1G7TT76_9LACT|nr:DNA-directed RNA polymerase subunit beta [Facklamia miroungae]NKZ29960.1 DNA-directed RNA polymerase subunit beta [Facklamia miroungae]SDG38445.1 DNA-directed RNA polymerase subunit beta [Facklamia miroungae]